ncbi:ABC transporter ATP-binding protein [Pelagibius sp. 7325]|uniref:ABC transporter ATP-binding protein n=1 Tax=Pelagibius sp. 7325 TaxID=3131994 RepID=UPI0030ECDC84
MTGTAAAEPPIAQPLVEVVNLRRVFRSGHRFGLGRFGFGQRLECRAVDGVTLTINRHETFGLVGESGCGKSTLGKLILDLLAPSDGRLLFAGRAPGDWGKRAFRRRAQLVFQDSLGALDPRLSVLAQVREPLDIHDIGPRAERNAEAARMLEEVGLGAAFHGRYPHQLSGGQQQRAVIARALVLKPDFVVCDEPVSALDVSIQAQVINLLQDMQARYGLTYLFISHDLSVVRHSADRIGVMYLGRLVELADGETLFERPLHPYTRALIAAVPIPDPRKRRAQHSLRGDPPSPFAPPPGCRFHTRCPHAEARCRDEDPVLRAVGGGHAVACHLAETLAEGPA